MELSHKAIEDEADEFLFPEEIAHVGQRSPFANQVANESKNGFALFTLMHAESGWPERGSAEMYIRMALVRSATSIRMAGLSLSIGYVAEASALTRAAYEALTFAYLFERRPDSMMEWLRLALIDDFGVQATSLMRVQAADAFVDATGEEGLAWDTVEDPGEAPHFSADSIARFYGPETLISEELGEALSVSDYDVDFAAKLMRWGVMTSPKSDSLEEIGTFSPGSEPSPEETIPTRKEYGDHTASVLKYVTLQLMQKAAATMPAVGSALDSDYRDWHERIGELRSDDGG
jgi:hypothetical protein